MRACGTPHPASRRSLVNDDLGRAFFKLLTTAPEETETRRRALLSFWRAQGSELAAADDQAVENAHDDVKTVLKANGHVKRPLLAKAMARAARYPHPEVMSNQTRGSPLIGKLPRNTAFPPDAPTGVLSEDWLRAQACFARSADEANARGRDPDQAREVLKKTREELEKGLLRGPFTAEQVGIVASN